MVEKLFTELVDALNEEGSLPAEKLDELINAVDEFYGLFSRREYSKALERIKSLIEPFTGQLSAKSLELYGQLINELEVVNIDDKQGRVIVDIEKEQSYGDINEIKDMVVAELNNKEGVSGAFIKVKGSFSYPQLKELSEDLFYEIGKLVFVLPDNEEITGMIIPTSKSMHTTTIPLIEVQYKFNKEADVEEPYLVFFSDNTPKEREIKSNSLRRGFYIYYLITDDNKKYIVFSDAELKSERYTLKGMFVSIRSQEVVKSAKISVADDIFIVHTAKPEIYEYPLEKLKAGMLKREDIERAMMGMYAKAYTQELKTLLILQALTYRQFTMPIHLYIIGSAGTFKSALLENIRTFYKEQFPVISATSTTIRGLVAKFGGQKAEAGELIKYMRIAPIDEFTDLIKSARVLSRDINEMSRLTSILDHKDVTLASGVGQISVELKARVLTAGNPRKTDYSLLDLIDDLTPQLASRFIIYFMSERDEELVDMVKPEIMMSGAAAYTKGNTEILSILMTLSNENVEIPEDLKDKILDAKKQLDALFTSDLEKQYWSRGYQHLLNVIAAYSKYRFLIGEKKDYKKVDSVDIDRAFNLLQRIYRRSIDVVAIMSLPIHKRIAYLDELEQDIFTFIKEKQYDGVTKEEIIDKFKKDKRKNILYSLYNLYSYELIKIYDVDGKYLIVPYDNTIFKGYTLVNATPSYFEMKEAYLFGRG